MWSLLHAHSITLFCPKCSQIAHKALTTRLYSSSTIRKRFFQFISTPCNSQHCIDAFALCSKQHKQIQKAFKRFACAKPVLKAWNKLEKEFEQSCCRHTNVWAFIDSKVGGKSHLAAHRCPWCSRLGCQEGCSVLQPLPRSSNVAILRSGSLSQIG